MHYFSTSIPTSLAVNKTSMTNTAVNTVLRFLMMDSKSVRNM